MTDNEYIENVLKANPKGYIPPRGICHAIGTYITVCRYWFYRYMQTMAEHEFQVYDEQLREELVKAVYESDPSMDYPTAREKVRDALNSDFIPQQFRI